MKNKLLQKCISCIMAFVMAFTCNVPQVAFALGGTSAETPAQLTLSDSGSSSDDTAQLAAVLQGTGSKDDPLVGGETITVDGTYYVSIPTTVTSLQTITINDGLDVTLIGQGGTYNDPAQKVSIQCGKDVHLTLQDIYSYTNSTFSGTNVNFSAGDNTLTIKGTVLMERDANAEGYAMIHVPSESSLLINGDGTFYGYKREQAAGIGGANGELNGAITLGDANNGSPNLRFFLKGSKQGAVIGTGAASSALQKAPGDIVINSGTYTLINVARGACIGGSAGSSGAQKGGNVYVNGGSINVNVDFSGAAIGGGGYDHGIDSTGGNVFINGGSIRTFIDKNAISSWSAHGVTEAGVNDVAITALKTNSALGEGEVDQAAQIKVDTSTLTTPATLATSFDVTIDGKAYAVAGLHAYKYVNENYDKDYGEQKTISHTVDNWVYNTSDETVTGTPNDPNLYLYAAMYEADGTTPATHTVVVNGDTFKYTYNTTTKAFELVSKVNVDSSITGGTVSVTPTEAAQGETITVTVTPDEGKAVKSVTYTDKDGKVTTIDLKDGAYSFTMPAGDVTVSATFAAALDITVAQTEHGSATTSPEGSTVEGATVTVTATPDTGYMVDKVTYKAASAATATEVTPVDDVYSFTMPNESVTVNVTFKLVPYTVSAAESEEGVVTPSAANANMGDTVTVTAEPKAGYQVSKIFYKAQSAVEATEITPVEGVYSFTMPADNVEVSAEYTKIPYTVSITQPAAGATISLEKSVFTVGDSVVVNIACEEGYEVRSVTYTDSKGNKTSVKADDGVYNFAMPADTVTVTAFVAHTYVWDGTTDTTWYSADEDSFVITTPEQLAGIAVLCARGVTFAGKTITLANDIYLNETAFSQGSDPSQWKQVTSADGFYAWVPIAGDGLSSNAMFNGTFDGAGHTIYNMFCPGSFYDGTGTSGSYGGLFGFIDRGSVIKNVCVTGYSQGRVVGGIVGSLGSGGKGNLPVIENCVNKCDVFGDGSGTRGTGGIVGGQKGAGGTIVNCVNAGTIYNDYRPAGGIVGVGVGEKVVNCYSYGTVKSAGGTKYQGAVMGTKNTSTYTNCLYLDSSCTAACSYPSSTEGKSTAAELKAAASTLGLAFYSSAEATLMSVNSNDNDGYPELFWQKGQAALNIEKATASAIADQTYTGSEIKPAVALTYDGTTLTSGIDYVVKGYADNVNVGEASIVIEGMGAFDGSTAVITFDIVPNTNVTVGNIDDQDYTGSAVEPDVAVTTESGNTLVNGTDYAIAYQNNVNTGTATATIVLSDNYGSAVYTRDFDITAASISTAVIGDIDSQLYTGSEIKPEVTVTYGDQILVEGTDYVVAYLDNVNPGTATVKVVGKGNFTGVLTSEFAIASQAISDCSIAAIGNRTYTGKAIEPALTIVDKSGNTLVEGTDYEVAYENNIEVGTATITVTGMGNYAGTASVEFGIIAAWDGTVDVSWYDPDATVIHISTPAQLAGVAAICNGLLLNGVTTDSDKFIGDASLINPHGQDATHFYGGVDSFKGKTIILDNDLDMGGVYNAETGEWSGPLYQPIGGQFLFDSSTGLTDIVTGESLSASFAGNFDGNGHYVNNIYCNMPTGMSSQSIGLIGRLGNHDNDPSSTWTDSLYVKNVGITGWVRGGRSVGGIVGKTGQTKNSCIIIANCVNKASVSSTDAKGCGGIVGAGWNSTKGMIINCYNRGTVTLGYTNASGGIVGSAETQLINCYNTGKVTQSSGQSAAIGSNNSNSSTSNCYWLEGSGNIGWYPSSADTTTKLDESAMKALAPTLGSGFVEDTEGINDGYPILFWEAGEQGYDITEATVASVIPDQEYTGSAISPAGIVTLNGETLVAGVDYTATCTNNTNVGTATLVSITGIGRYSGTIEVNKTFNIVKGDLSKGSIDAIATQWYTGTALTPSITVKNSAGATVTSSLYEVTYRNNDDEGTAFVTATAKETSNYTGSITASFQILKVSESLKGAGTEEDPYQITSDKDLEFVANAVKNATAPAEGNVAYDVANYKIMNDFESDYAESIGSAAKPFSGTIDGDNHTITMNRVNNVNGSLVGLIGWAYEIHVSDLTIDGAVTNNKGTAAAFVYGLTRKAGVVHTSTFENCVNAADITATSSAAGFVAEGNDSQANSSITFTDCANYGDVTGTARVGGFMANNVNLIVGFDRCANYGDITTTGSSQAAGITTYMTRAGSYINLCTNQGDITSASGAAAGLVAVVQGNLTTQATSANFTITDSYNTGYVSAYHKSYSTAGAGIAAYAYGKQTYLQIVGCFNSGLIDNDEEAYSGALVGCVAGASTSKSTVELLGGDYMVKGTSPQAATVYQSGATLYGNLIDNSTVIASDNTLNKTLAKSQTYLEGSALPRLYWEVKKSAIELADVACADIADQAYTGSAIIPALTITNGEDADSMIAYVDYIPTLENNTNVGTAKVASITGIGRMTGTAELNKEFNITSVDLANCTIDEIAAQWTYAASPAKPAITVKQADGTVVPATDYTVEYTDNTETGTATVTVTPSAKGNLTGSASATFEVTLVPDALEGTGTADDPYQVGSAAEMERMALMLNSNASARAASYKITDDIDASATESHPAVDAMCITTSNSFKGTIDGNNKTITLGLERTGSYTALIGVASACTIKDLTVAGTVSSTGSYVGGFVGYDFGGSTYTNCVNAADITAASSSASNMGGIVGYVAYNASLTTTFENCVNEGDLAGCSVIGGILGCTAQNTVFKQCENTGNITNASVAVGQTNCFGGILGGMARGATAKTITIDECANLGDIAGGAQCGGIVGYLYYNATANISNVYNSGLINPTYSVMASSASSYGSGGIIGTIDVTTNVTITNAYNAGNYQSTSSVPKGAMVGSIPGSSSSVTMNNCYMLSGTYAMAVGSQGTTAKVIGEATTVDSDALKALAPSLGASFVADEIDYNDGYPILYWQAGLDQIEMTDTDIADIDDQAYAAGEAIEPVVEITYGDKTLAEGLDYTVEYADNTEVGTATITVTGLGIYTGTADKTFEIVAKNVDECVVAPIADQIYTGSAIEPALTITNGDETLVAGTDYSVAYRYNTEVGTAEATIMGFGTKYTGTTTVNFNIVAADLANCTVAPIDTCRYTGKAIEPELTITTPAGYELVAGTDYVVAYVNNVEAGTANVSIVGKGSFSGQVNTTFTIEKVDLTALNEAIAAAEAAAEATEISEDGKDVANGGSYVSEEDATAFIAAVVVAKLVAEDGEANQATIDEAKAELEKAQAAFEAAKKTASADAKALVEDIAAAKVLQESAEVSEDGTDVARDDCYVTPEVAKAMTDAIAAAEAVANNTASSQDEIDAAKAALDEACEDFNNAVEQGNESATWTRLAGDTALDTMSDIASEGFETSDVAIVATSNSYWDALAASALAGAYDAPILLTESNTLSAQTKSELERLGTTKVFIVGGKASVSDEVKASIEGMEKVTSVKRIAGEDATETAEAIAKAANAVLKSDTCVLTTLNGYYDALSMAPVAYAQGYPVYLTSASNDLDASTFAAIKSQGYKNVIIVGGVNSVTQNAAEMLAEAGMHITRIAGEDAWQTSNKIAEYGISVGMTANNMAIADGNGYWDALTGAALCGINNSVMVLVPHDAEGIAYDSYCIDNFIASHKSGIAHGYAFGGLSSVPETTVQAAEDATK